MCIKASTESKRSIAWLSLNAAVCDLTSEARWWPRGFHNQQQRSASLQTLCWRNICLWRAQAGIVVLHLNANQPNQPWVQQNFLVTWEDEQVCDLQKEMAAAARFDGQTFIGVSYSFFFFFFLSLCLRITESQNSRGWKGPLWVI